MKNGSEERMHFSTQINEWTGCDATQKTCKYDHISKNEYEALMNIQEQEGMLVNSSLGQAQISYIQAKTSMTTEEIQNILRELRREGSVMTKPTENELRKFIEQEKFKVENDESLTAKEKRAILKNLKQAEKDLDANGNQTTGGILHAWKNGIKTAFNRVKKPLLAGALIGSLSFGLAACAPNNNAAPPEKEGTGNSQVVEDTKVECDDVEVTGDVVAGEQAKTIDGGTYCTLAPNFEGHLNGYNSDVVNPSMYEAGYTDEELATVQAEGTRFLVNTIMSNPNQGSSSDKTNGWIKKQTDTMSPELIEALTKPKEEGRYFTSEGLALNTGEIMPPLVADGGAQVTKSTIEVGAIGPRVFPDGSQDASQGAAVTFVTTTTYRVDPKKYQEWRENYLTNVGLKEYIDTVKEEGQDFSKPLFIDHKKEVTVNYDVKDVKSGLKDSKVRSLGTTVGDLNNVIAYN